MRIVSRSTLKALFVLLLCTVVYFWRILLTHEYTILAGYEQTSLNYAWLHFWIVAVRAGTLPLWNPHAWGGYPFGGPMQTAAFYPLHLLLVLFPFNRHGLFSPHLCQDWFAFTHFLGGCFMFALARELRLGRFSSLIAGICFSMGGVVGGAVWAFLVQSMIWLPLIFLFLLRALRAEKRERAALYASLSGLSLGLAILAGGLHMVIMQALVVVSAVAFAAFDPQLRQKGPLARALIRPAMVLAIVAGVAFCAGAVQLLVSSEYSHYAVRFLGPGALPPGQRIPSNYPPSGLWPHGLFGMLLSYGFSGKVGPDEVLPMYMGVFPLLAAIIGIWKRWEIPWVRYLAGLAGVVFLYALGDFSAVYGVLRALIPYLWMAREAARFMYLADFAVAILAAYGVEALLHGPSDQSAWRPLTRVLTWIVVACAVAQAIPAVFDRPGVNPWVSLSFLLIAASFGLYRLVIGGRSGAAVRFVMVALIVFDLTSFHWGATNKADAARTDSDDLERAISTRGAVDFLRSRPGRFRVYILTNDWPPIGDLFRVSTSGGGAAAALLNDYLALLWNGHLDLLNSRYVMKPASASESGDIYHDSKWKVYENPKAYPAAWMVHQTIVEPSPERLVRRMGSPEVDLHRQALVSAPLESRLEPGIEGAPEDVAFPAGGLNRLELTVQAHSRGLLVLSEIFYPGWRAEVNGKPARIYEVDAGLRGVVVPPGPSRVVLWYSPWSFRIGALLTSAAFFGTLLAVFLTWRRSRRPLPAA